MVSVICYNINDTVTVFEYVFVIHSYTVASVGESGKISNDNNISKSYIGRYKGHIKYLK